MESAGNLAEGVTSADGWLKVGLNSIKLPTLMSATIEIRISDEPTSETVHRFQNFGEDVYRALCATCPMSIDPIDCATTSFMIRGIRRRDLGTMTQTLKRLLKRYHFDQTATLTRR